MIGKKQTFKYFRNKSEPLKPSKLKSQLDHKNVFIITNAYKIPYHHYAEFFQNTIKNIQNTIRIICYWNNIIVRFSDLLN